MMKLKGWTRNILLIAGGLFLIFLLWYFSAIVTYILISVVLSFIGRPLVKWLSMIHYKKLRIPKGVAAFFTLIVIWIIFFSFFRFMIPLLSKELETLSEIDLEAFFNSIEEPLVKLTQLLGNEPLVVDDRSFFDVMVEQLT